MKKIFLVCCMFCFVFLFTGCFKKEVDNFTVGTSITQKEKEQENINNKFDEDLEKFNQEYKQALLLAERKDLESFTVNLDELNTSWSGVKEYFKDKKPIRHIEERHWTAMLDEVSVLIEEIKRAKENNDMEEIVYNFTNIREIINNLRFENEDGVEFVLVRFDETLRKVLLENDINGVRLQIVGLEKVLNDLKKYKVDNDFENKLKDLEEVVQELKDSDNDNLISAKEKLLSVFEEIYLQFG